jgi:DhnA family fructose-bisphosphate aldolase class Ia
MLPARLTQARGHADRAIGLSLDGGNRPSSLRDVARRAVNSVEIVARSASDMTVGSKSRVSMTTGDYLGVTIEADIIKQKLPELNGGYVALNTGGSSYGKLDKRMYSDLATDHPIDLCRYQILNCYCGRMGLINSGGASGENDFAEAAKTAVINKRAGGMGLISGRKAFQRPMAEGVKLLNTIQDVYLDPRVTIA